MDFLPDPKIMCHHTSFEKSCKDMVLNHCCRKWVKLQCKHPQTGADIDKWDCADTWAPLLDVAIIQAIENNVGGLQAATESFRNEVVKANQTAVQVIAATALRRPNGRAIEDRGDLLG